LTATGKPPALRSLVEEMREQEGPAWCFFRPDPDRSKAGIADYDAETAEIAMKEMIEKVIKGQGEFEVDSRSMRYGKMQQTVDGL
jgi:hypothetical protein